MNLTQLILFLARYIILYVFKHYIFILIAYIEKNYKSVEIRNLIFYAGIINEKISIYTNNYLQL